jgi:mono/diheme cytochrome c family protein
MPIDVRREALQAAGETDAKRANVLMQVAKQNEFFPEKTAKAITPLLLELSNEGVFSINKDLGKLLDSRTPGLRSAAVALKVRSGAPLGSLAERDPAALLDAVSSMSKEQTPDTLPATLIDLAEAGQLDAGQAIVQADRLSADKAALFERLAALAEPGMDASFDTWGKPHQLAMAALAGMHQTPESDWPKGFDRYRIARAEASVLELGKEKYFHEEKGCVKCHGEHGEGTAGFPPLSMSPMAVGDPVRAATIVRFGLMGPLPHSINPADGQPFSAQMEPLSYYSYEEMAAALTYVRQNFGNFAPPVTVQDVAAADSPEETMMWQADALLANFPFERDRLTGPIPAPPPPSIDIVKLSPPSFGLWLMLGLVAACMLLILGGTYAGKFLSNPRSLSDIAADHMKNAAH